MEKQKNNMTRDALLFLPAKILEGIILMLTTSSLYTAIFTESAYGTYQIFNTTILFLYLITSGWLSNSSTRYIAEEEKKDKGQAIYSTIFTAYTALFVVVLIGFTVLFFVTKEAVYFLLSLMYGSYTLFQILNSMLVQLGKIKQIIIYSLLAATLKFTIALVFIYVIPSSTSTPYPAIIAVTLADLTAAILSVITLKIPLYFSFKSFSKPLLKKLLNFGFPLMGVSISVGLLNMIDRYLVIYFFGDEIFAAYSANYSISSGIFTMINVAIMRGVYPAVLRAWNEKKEASHVRPLLNDGVRLYLLIAVPASLGLLAVSFSLSEVLFVKDSYHSGAVIIGLTAIAMLFMGLTEYSNKAYELNAKTTYVLQNSIVATIIKIISSIVFLNMFGFIGGALGSVFAFFSYFVITYIRASKFFVFRLSKKTLFNILLSGVLCFSGAFLVSFIPLNKFVSLFLSIVVGAILYALTLIITKEAENELFYIKNILKNGGHNEKNY